MKYGSMMFKKVGAKRRSDVAQRMRTVARLRIILGQKQQNPNCHLSEYLTGAGFDQIIEAVEELGGAYMAANGRWGYKNPSIATKLGHALEKLAQIKIGQAIRNSSAVDKEQAEAFLALHTSDYTDLVASPAIHSINSRDNTLLDLPADEDLNTLRNYLAVRMTTLCAIMRKDPNVTIWRELSEVAACRLIIFNARRGGEITSLLLSDFEARDKYAIRLIETMGMDDVEKLLVKRYCTYTN